MARSKVGRGRTSSAAEEPPLHTETIKYLGELAQASFARQAELDESVWRSLPFFAAALALGVTLLNGVAAGLPALSAGPLAVASNILMWLSVLAFVWTLRWFWEVVKARTYAYPASDVEVWSYAEQVTRYHAALGLLGPSLDEQVVNDLRTFMAGQLGDAARTNLANNQRRLKARSQLLLFVMVGFVLVILAQGITYGGNVLASVIG